LLFCDIVKKVLKEQFLDKITIDEQRAIVTKYDDRNILLQITESLLRRSRNNEPLMFFVKILSSYNKRKTTFFY